MGAVLKILEDVEWQSYMCNKIYRREVFEGILFPIGRQLDDDTSVMHHIFHRASRVIYLKRDYYFYFHHPGSICSSMDDINRARKIIERCDARYERYLFTRDHPEYHAMLVRMTNSYLSVALAGLRYAVKHLDLFPEGHVERERTRILEINMPSSQQMPQFFSRGKRVEYFLFMHCYPLYRFLAVRTTK